MKKFVYISLLVFVVVFLIWGFGSSAQAAAPAPNRFLLARGGCDDGGSIYYTVQPGDHLASIARRYCTTWQDIYALNRDVIGPDPDHLVAGMVLTIPARCGGGGDCGNVFDRGWLPHAQGYIIPPNGYWVEKGDTWYSIGKRFGVSVRALRRFNGQYYPYAFTVVRIPCLNAGPSPVPPISPPPATPVPRPTATPPPAVIAHITIDFPPANAVLPNTFTVNGRGGGLPEANVVVRVKDGNGNVLAEKATMLQGENVGLGGEGTWSVEMTIAPPATSSGVIEAYAPGTSAFASVPVFFQNAGSIDYSPGQCHVQVNVNTRAFSAPNGEYLGNFSGDGTFEANRREWVSGEAWYRLPIRVGSYPAIWVKASELTGVSAGCN